MLQKPLRHLTFHPMKFATITLLFMTLSFLVACKTTSPPPPVASNTAAAVATGVPGGVFVSTVEVSVKVTAVDTTKQKLTILFPDGEKTTVKVGPEEVSIDQIQPGDLVVATLTEELVIYLDKEGAAVPDAAAAMVALAPQGAKPGGLIAGTVQVTATVVAINQNRRMATLRFEDGRTETFPVRDDIDLSQRKVGEKVVFLVTEMIAIDIKKP